ncbi:uncharacterized protein moto isoform X1 [Nothobranchius furzeri]|uniref:Transcript variant X1 n=2 Tax=Nothobranchius furzeri TaxID=105023 RepID=A0A8C6KGF8_NOTFU|nr:transcript variant X1 [Nothobranchius furzeri]KAF7225740.1 transcript variant X2 [Nothobranchius furzeri]
MDGHQSRSVTSLQQTRQRQTGVSGVGSGRMPASFAPMAPRPGQDSTSYRSWFSSSQAEPSQLSFPKNSKSIDEADCDGEADLQGLVSNILDEADSQDSFYSGSLPTRNPIWSPKALNEELLQYLQWEAKTPNNSSFPSNHLSHKAFSNVQLQSVLKNGDGLSQQSSGLGGNKQCFSLPNGDNYSLHSQKPPPGLPLPQTHNTKPSHMHQMTDINMSPCNDRRNNQPLNNFPELSSIFHHQNEINNSCFDAHHGDHYTQSSVNSFWNENCVPEDPNQLVSSFQSFIPSEHNGTCHDDFPNIHKQTVGLHKDGLPEQWKTSSPAMSMLSFPAMQSLKQLFGDVGSVQRGRAEEARKQNHHACRGPLDFSPQHVEYFQKSKALSAHFNFPNQHQNGRSIPNETSNLRVNHFAKQVQPSHIQKNMNSQMERGKTKMQMSGFHGDGFSVRQQGNITEGRIQPLSPYPHFNLQGNMQSARPDREKNTSGAGHAPHFIPLMYPVNDPRRCSGIPMSSNFISRSTVPYGNGVSGMNVNEMMPTNEAAAFSSSVSNTKAHRAGNTFGMAPALASSLMSQGGPAVQLYVSLDDCYEQWRCLEKGRKKMEIFLKKNFPGKKTLITTSNSLPEYPPNPTRVDHLVINLMREQIKVESILVRMKCLCSIPLHISIEMALRNHYVALCITQARCKEGSDKWTKIQQQGVGFTEDRDNLLLIAALNELAATTRRLCTALWCTLQMTMQPPVLVQEHHACEEPTCTERCSSLFQGYTFCL